MSVESRCREFLKSKGLNPSEEWLKKEIETLTNGGPQIILDQQILQKANSEDISLIVNEGTFPEDLDELHKVELKGPYFVQVNDYLDVSLSNLEQLQIIEKDEVEFKRTGNRPLDKLPKLSRVLKLTLSDGIRELTAMEYQPISKIPNKIPLGTKV